jgi:hypothetical protein
VTEEISFEQFQPAIETLTLFGSTLPPPVALAATRAVIAHMASGMPSADAAPAIANAFAVFRALHAHTSTQPDPELPPGWKGTVAWWSERSARPRPLVLALVEGHLRSPRTPASRRTQALAPTRLLAEEVLVPHARQLFGQG